MLEPKNESELERLWEELGVTAHAILPLPGVEAARAALRSPAAAAELAETLRLRQERIRRAEEDPLAWGFELPTWADADGLLAGAECNVLAVFGGNRSGKTYYGMRRVCQAMDSFPGTRIVVLSENVTASITRVEAIAWEHFQGRYGHLNGKRDVVFKLNYTQANGWSERKLVLPNASELYFLTYNQNPGDFEGWEFGAAAGVYERVRRERAAKGEACPPNIGALADESMPLAWLQMLMRRIRFRKAKVLWTFTPVKGITPAVKELVGSSAETVAHRASELLPRKNLPDLPEGRMPYIRRCVTPKAMAIYFFSEMTPFGPEAPKRTYYDEVKELCAGKTSEYVERVAYGLARDSVARAFPKFGPWNVVKREQLPAVGTNYFFCDPAGTRNWFMFWVRVTPGDPPSHYIYRDWPDAATYGEWAVPTEREVNEEQRKGWDGDAGPAQIGSGLGVVGYKRLILEAERITGPSGDPYRDRRWERAKAGGQNLGEVREQIAERYVDPRAGASEHLAEQGGTCIVEEFALEQKDGKGRVTGPGMWLVPASGVGRRQGTDENEGLTLVNELLDWNLEEPLCAVLNQPHLYVSEDCLQVRWMFENYTGRGGEKGACKDPADLARYMALAKLEHVAEGVRRRKPGAGF